MQGNQPSTVCTTLEFSTIKPYLYIRVSGVSSIIARKVNFKVVLATLCGLGNLGCGLGNLGCGLGTLKVWSTFSLSRASFFAKYFYAFV